MSHDDTSINGRKWLQNFTKKHGRAPRILHIGNIANNAYLNAKILNQAGIDCDVFAYNYFHIMGCPEWEDADFIGQVDEFQPNWHKVNLNGFYRPEWFAQGPLILCSRYLIARRTNDKLNIFIYSQILKMIANPINYKRLSALYKKVSVCKPYLLTVKNKLLWLFGIYKNITARFFSLSLPIMLFLFVILLPVLLYLLAIAMFFCLGFAILLAPVVIVFLLWRVIYYFANITKDNTDIHQNDYSFDNHISFLVKQFSQVFPLRKDKLTTDELEMYRSEMYLWCQIFQHYDIVHGYAIDGTYPLLANKPYVAYEHGTIRQIPFEDSLIGRLCALTYKQANGVCITNADNILAAKKLELENYSFVPHPINEEFMEKDNDTKELTKTLHEELKSDFIIFHPSRQHWESQRSPNWEKGNDIFIKGFARFVKEVAPNAAAIFIDWGKCVEKSKQLLYELDISKRVKWLKPLPNRTMIRYIHATELLADQFYLGAFGSTMPKALACGRPSIIYLNPEIHHWCFPEMPPVLNTKTETEVFIELKKIYSDSQWYHSVATKGKKWYYKYHSNQIITDKLLDIYARALNE